jgi:hypothetical protein
MARKTRHARTGARARPALAYASGATYHVDAGGERRGAVRGALAACCGFNRGDVSRRFAHLAAQHQLVLLQVPQRLAQLLRVDQQVLCQLVLLDPAAPRERVQNHARHAMQLQLLRWMAHGRSGVSDAAGDACVARGCRRAQAAKGKQERRRALSLRELATGGGTWPS